MIQGRATLRDLIEFYDVYDLADLHEMLDAEMEMQPEPEPMKDPRMPGPR